MKNKKLFEPVDEANMTPDALEALVNAGFSRRNFLKGTGALIVGFGAADMAGKLGSSASAAAAGMAAQVIANNEVDSWVAIAADGKVTAFAGKSELGQGMFTVQNQLIAEELYVPLSRVSLTICDTALCPDQGTTSGSQSHPTQFGTSGLRQACATAREHLFYHASARLGVPVDQLTVADGVISVKSDATRKVTYGELVGGQKLNIRVNPLAKFKDPKTYTILGTSVPRYDLPAIITGTLEYVNSVRVPGMVHARVVRPPAVGATLVSVDETSVKDIPGLVKVVVIKDFVAVVAQKEWQAIQAAQKLKVTWTKGSGLPKQQDIYETLRNQKSTRDTYLTNSKDVDATLANSAKVFKSTYLHPYNMHGSIGASCAVADIKTDASGKVTSGTIWSPTQGVYPQRNSAALLLGLTAAEASKIRVIWRMGSGCYGINGSDAVSFDAAVISKAVGKPVRVLLSRQDEMAWENYGPAFVIDERIGVDAQGNITAWDYEAWSPSLGGRPGNNQPGNTITGFLLGFAPGAFTPRTPAPDPTGNFSNGSNTASNYVRGCIGNNCGGTGTVKSERFLSHGEKSFFWTGPLRSPARLQNTFAHESFIDEVAAALKVDPLEYRLRHLNNVSPLRDISGVRMADLFKATAKAANWVTRPSPLAGNPATGVVTGRGIAGMLYEGDNGYGVVVAEVEVNQSTGKVRVKRFVVGADCGPVSNPDGLRNQNEGGTLQGMSRALLEEVTWDDQRVTSIDWVTYPTYRFGDGIPEVLNVLIDRRDVLQMGAGEVTITAVAAAIGNAIFDATGARVRQLPFRPERVLAALKARGTATEEASTRTLRPEDVMQAPMGSDHDFNIYGF